MSWHRTARCFTVSFNNEVPKSTNLSTRLATMPATKSVHAHSVSTIPAISALDNSATPLQAAHVASKVKRRPGLPGGKKTSQPEAHGTAEMHVVAPKAASKKEQSTSKKTGPKRKQSGTQDGGHPKKPKPSAVITPPPENPAESKTLSDLLLTEDDLELAVDTLQTLAENPSLIKSKACKNLRVAVFGFRQACTMGFNSAVDTNLTSRVSGALADGGYTEARILLAEMRIRGQKPKLGALCRWVRDLDVVSGLAEQLSEEGARTAREEQLLMVLDAILRLTGPVDFTVDKNITVIGPVIPRSAWDLRDQTRPRKMVYESVLDRSILKSLPPDCKSQFRIIETTPGPQRKPANLHPAKLYASRDNTIPLSSTAPRPTHHLHPVVPNLHLLKDVLSPQECLQIIAAGEEIGFTPDAPVRGEGEESSILAHNFYWVVDEAFNSALWDRVKAFIPSQIDGKQVRGLNRRFRVYRYIPGAEYRAHIGIHPLPFPRPANTT